MYFTAKLSSQLSEEASDALRDVFTDNEGNLSQPRSPEALTHPP